MRVVMFSGGISSWATAKRVAERYGTDNLVLLFTDTKHEDPDLYRFLHEAAANVGGKLVIIADGRDPWQVFKDRRLLGNSRYDVCSHYLKRVVARRWVDEHCNPQRDVLYLGFGWDEVHRLERARKRWKPYRVEAPLTELPILFRDDLFRMLAAEGLRPPFLYTIGAQHNNCGGFCVRAGVSHYKWLYETLPERYLEFEQKEQEVRAFLGKDVAILKDRRGGKTRPLTLRELRKRLEGGAKCSMSDWGGRGCFV